MGLKTILRRTKSWFVDATAVVVASTPVFAAMETFFGNRSISESLNARIIAALLGFAGLIFLYAWLRDYSRSKFNLNKNGLGLIHDSIFGAIFNFMYTLPLYFFNGGNPFLASLGAAVIGLFSGVINGYSIDLFRDYLGVKPSLRKPRFIFNFDKKTKYTLAIIIICLSFILTGLIYLVRSFLS